MSLLVPLSSYAVVPDVVVLPPSSSDGAARRVYDPQVGLDSLLTGSRRQAEPIGQDWRRTESTVRDTTDQLPRRRASDRGLAPGFPSSGFVAQVLAQQAFPPNPTRTDSRLAAYQATLQRSQLAAGPGISLSV